MKVALITGAGSGIGRATALALVRQEWSVVITGRREDALVATRDAAGTKSTSLLVAPADVTDEASVSKLFASIQSAFGRLDLLFNNAGISAPGVLLEDLTMEQWHNVVDVNLT